MRRMAVMHVLKPNVIDHNYPRKSDSSPYFPRFGLLNLLKLCSSGTFVLPPNVP